MSRAPKWYEVRTSIWATGWFRNNPSDAERLLAMYLLTCPQRLTSGPFEVDMGEAAHHLNWSIGKLEQVWERLDNAGFFIEEDGLVELMPMGFFRHHKPGSVRPSIPLAVKRAIFDRDGSTCVVCGSPDRPEIDHIVPWSRGGTNDLSNLRILCRRCNVDKGDKLDSEWMEVDE